MVSREERASDRLHTLIADFSGVPGARPGRASGNRRSSVGAGRRRNPTSVDLLGPERRAFAQDLARAAYRLPQSLDSDQTMSDGLKNRLQQIDTIERLAQDAAENVEFEARLAECTLLLDPTVVRSLDTEVLPLVYRRLGNAFRFLVREPSRRFQRFVYVLSGRLQHKEKLTQFQQAAGLYRIADIGARRVVLEILQGDGAGPGTPVVIAPRMRPELRKNIVRKSIRYLVGCGAVADSALALFD